MKVKNTCATFAFCALSVLSVSGKNNCSQEQFINLLNIEKGYKPMPQGFFFADLGGWHGYGFNRKSDLSLAGGFRGPAFAGERSLGLQWLSDCLSRLVLKENGKDIPFEAVGANEYLPGMLRQSLDAKELAVHLKEIAISDRSTLTEYEIRNEGNSEREIEIGFTGKLTYKDASCKAVDGDDIHVGVKDGRHHFIFSFSEDGNLQMDGTQGYMMNMGSRSLRPGKSVKLYVFTTYCPASTEQEAMAEHQSIRSNETEKYFKENKKRWEGYIRSIVDRPTPYMESECNRKWAVKALMTLHTNWRSAAGDLKHGDVQPATGHFNAFWAWDSWEHAAALAVFNPELAKEQMLTMFDYQTPEGMIVDLIALDKKENNNVCSKPPIAGWATYMVYRRTKDKAFVKEMLPKLLKFHEWRYKYRDHDGNGLCEYGGIGPEVYMGQWESGMDVAVKFDGVKMLKNAEGAWSFDQESIELNSYLCAEKFYLAYMLDEIGEKEQASQFRADGNKLRKIFRKNSLTRKQDSFMTASWELGSW